MASSRRNESKAKLRALSLLLGCALLAPCSSGEGGDEDDAAGGKAGAASGGGPAGQHGGSGGGAGLGGEPASGGQGGDPLGQAGGGGGGQGGVGNQPPLVDFGLEQRPQNKTCGGFDEPPTGMPDDPFPTKLSATGCFAADNPREPVAGLIPYDVSSPLWSDAALKRRWLALPEGGKVTVDDKGDFDFPNGSVLLKSFELGGQMLETRFLIRHQDGTWAGYTYVWDQDGKDATLLGPNSDSRFVGDVDWVFPSRMNCLECHTEAAGRTVGLEIGQLNSEYVYPGQKRANQLKTLEHIGVFDKPLGDIGQLVTYPRPTVRSAGTLEQRARAYLHANCSHCHRPGGVKDVGLDLRFSTTLAAANICNVTPNKGDFGYKNEQGDGARILWPGLPELSMISIRMNNVIPNVRMPQIGTSVIDADGVKVIDEWIKGLAGCP